MEDLNKKIKVPHHEQVELCTTRLPYRQGRKVTAIKVYTVNNESKHLLIFGVPVLNLRQEIKSVLTKFGKLEQFGLTDKYPNELFTETYHVVFEKIQSARVAKKKLDTNNFYGGILHICYAPELETIEEVGEKLLLRKKEVMQRLQRNSIDRQDKLEDKIYSAEEQKNNSPKQLINMGEVNIISKDNKNVYNKILKRSSEDKKINISAKKRKSYSLEKPFQTYNSSNSLFQPKLILKEDSNSNRDLKDITLESNRETVIRIETPLNFNKFGSEIIRRCPKPLNKIIFTLNK